MSTKTKGLPDPLPPTAPIPQTGWHFFRANSGASYRLARLGIIPTIDVGNRNKKALPRVLARKLDQDATTQE
jgi:hypothetical protein